MLEILDCFIEFCKACKIVEKKEDAWKYLNHLLKVLESAQMCFVHYSVYLLV